MLWRNAWTKRNHSLAPKENAGETLRVLSAPELPVAAKQKAKQCNEAWQKEQEEEEDTTDSIFSHSPIIFFSFPPPTLQLNDPFSSLAETDRTCWEDHSGQGQGLSAWRQ